MKLAEVLGFKMEISRGSVYFPTKLKDELTTVGYMPKEKGLIPVVGLAEAGKGIDSVDDYPEGGADMFISRPSGLKDFNAYGVLVEGDSMYPAYKPRSIVVCSPNIECQSGDTAVIGLKSGERLIGEIHFNDTIIIKKYNPKYNPIEIKRSDISFCHRIMWVKL